MEFLNHVAVLGGLAVLVVQEILKFKLVPVQWANKYPVPVLIVLSIIASVVISLSNWAEPANAGQWIQLVVTIGLVAAFTYNHTIKNWTEVRQMEG